jgi:hypothetical protein
MRRRSATSPTWARTQRSSQVSLANNHCFGQCCGSGMFIPDPHYFHPRSRVKKIPGSGSASKNLTQKIVSNLSDMIQDLHSGCGSRILIFIFYLSRIPDPGVKNAPDPGYGSATATLRIWIFMDLALIYPGSGSRCNEIDQYFILTAFNF